MNTENSTWKVGMTSKAAKGKDSLPLEMRIAFYALLRLLKHAGPVQSARPHYSKLAGQKKEAHHCHLNKGKPTYVVIWNVLSKQEKIMEISYVGTHENAPY